jgi:putative flippase GtrA
VLEGKTKKQFLLYVAAGLITNLLGYGLYLLITWAGLGHKSTMTLLFFIGIAISFWINRAWAFQSESATPGAFARFVVAYLLGFAYNFLLLWLMVDFMGFDHAIIQAIAVATLSLILFVLQKYWIFRPQST